MTQNPHCEIDHLITHDEMEDVLAKLNGLDLTLKSLATANQTCQLERDISSLRSFVLDNHLEQKTALNAAEDRLLALATRQPRGSLFFSILGFFGALAVLLLAVIGTAALVTGKPMHLKDIAKAEAAAHAAPDTRGPVAPTGTLSNWAASPQSTEPTLQEQVDQLRQRLDALEAKGQPALAPKR